MKKNMKLTATTLMNLSPKSTTATRVLFINHHHHHNTMNVAAGDCHNNEAVLTSKKNNMSSATVMSSLTQSTTTSSTTSSSVMTNSNGNNGGVILITSNTKDRCSSATQNDQDQQQQAAAEERKRYQTQIFLMKQDLTRLTSQMVDKERDYRQRESVLQSEITRLHQINDELTEENEELVTEIQDVMYELERSYKQLSDMSKTHQSLRDELSKAIKERDDIAERFFDEIQHDSLSIKEQLEQVRCEERAKVAAIAAEERLAEQYLELQKIENDKLRNQVEYLQQMLKEAQVSQKQQMHHPTKHSSNSGSKKMLSLLPDDNDDDEHQFNDARMNFLREHKQSLLVRKASSRRNKLMQQNFNHMLHQQREQHHQQRRQTNITSPRSTTPIATQNEGSASSLLSSSAYYNSASSTSSPTTSGATVKKMASSLVKNCTSAVSSYLTTTEKSNQTSYQAPYSTGRQNRSLSLNHLAPSYNVAINARAGAGGAGAGFSAVIHSTSSWPTPPRSPRFKWRSRSEAITGGNSDPDISAERPEDHGSSSSCVSCPTSARTDGGAEQGLSTFSTIPLFRGRDLKSETLRESVYSHQGLSTSDLSESGGVTGGNSSSYNLGETIVDFNPEVREARQRRARSVPEEEFLFELSGDDHLKTHTDERDGAVLGPRWGDSTSSWNSLNWSSSHHPNNKESSSSSHWNVADLVDHHYNDDSHHSSSGRSLRRCSTSSLDGHGHGHKSTTATATPTTTTTSHAAHSVRHFHFGSNHRHHNAEDEGAENKHHTKPTFPKLFSRRQMLSKSSKSASSIDNHHISTTTDNHHNTTSPGTTHAQPRRSSTTTKNDHRRGSITSQEHQENKEDHPKTHFSNAA